MRNTLWKASWLGLFAAGASLLSACGGGNTTTGTGGTGATGGSTTSTGGSTTSSTGSTTSTPMAKPDGAPCMVNDECSNGFCLTQAMFGWPYGYCTGPCNNIAACEASSTCVGIDGNGDTFCLQNCKADADCGAGRTCFDLMDMAGTKVCAPHCSTDDECKGYGLCDKMGGFCYVPEDCDKVGDEDGNGAADCEDATCAAKCQTQLDAACGAAVAIDLTAAPVSKMGDTSSGTDIFAGTCAGSTQKEAIYKVTNNSGKDSIVELSLLSDTDLGVYVRAECGKPAELGCADGVGGGTDPEVVDVDLAKGKSFFAYVDGSTFSGMPRDGKYTLTATLVSTQPEAEKNDTQATANTVSTATLPTVVVASLDQAADNSDWFLVDTTGSPGMKKITAESIGSGGDTCAGLGGSGDIDTYIEIVGENGMVLSPADPMSAGTNEDVGLGNWCSLAVLDMAGPGKYFVHVKTSDLCKPMAGGPDCVFKYGLKINVQ